MVLRLSPNRGRRAYVRMLLPASLIVASLFVVTTSHAGTDSRTASRRPSKLIVVGQGVSGVRLGDSPKRVTSSLGTPASTQPPYWTYPHVETRVTFESGEVTDIWTESTGERTSKGIGPGVNSRNLKRAYPKVQCRAARSTAAVACSLLSTTRGRSAETDFLILGTTVRAVEIYFARRK
jgi:hypothetical protein